MHCKYLIIGGGASGLMLAARLDLTKEPDSQGLILERTGRPGAKLLMSGGGRCNITHGGSIKNFINCYGPAGSRLRKCLYRHSNSALASWLEENGIPLANEKGSSLSSRDLDDAGRIFPASHRSSEVLDLLLRKASANGWELRTSTEVYGLTRSSDGWSVLTSSDEDLTVENIIIATGGITFPETGSDGSLLPVLRELGVDIVPPRSALAPVYVDDYPYEELSGISIENVSAAVYSPDSSGSKGKKLSGMTGDLLFTHKGFSGPVILNISRYAEPGSILSISYNKAFEQLPKRLQRSLESRSRGPSGDIRTKTLHSLLESDDFTITSVDRNGMVTSGGISLDEIDMNTMQLSRYTGLYAIGESIDADGITGGYNLQMCWSTASAAADALAAAGPRD